MIRENQTEKMNSAIAMPGDSGSPVICRDSSGHLQLIGILSMAGGSALSDKNSENSPSATGNAQFRTISNTPDLNLINGLPAVPRKSINLLPELPPNLPEPNEMQTPEN